MPLISIVHSQSRKSSALPMGYRQWDLSRPRGAGEACGEKLKNKNKNKTCNALAAPAFVLNGVQILAKRVQKSNCDGRPSGHRS